MEKLKSFLKELGFGKNEIQVYTSLIAMPESTVLEISKKTKTHRSNIYEALESLTNKGLVSSFEDPVKKYCAKDPKILLEFLKNKELELKEILKNIRNKIKTPTESKIGKTRGKNALIESIFNLIEEGKPIFVYGMKKDTHKKIGPTTKTLEEKRLKNKIPIKVIFDSHSDSIMKIMDKKELMQVKSLPSIYDSDITTWVCKDKVLIVNWNKEISITKIHDAEIAKSYSQYFNLLWSGAKCEVCKV